ncbi:MAG: hypothetical protein ACR2P6_03020 [Gammaproteobacteria bacterium]
MPPLAARGYMVQLKSRTSLVLGLFCLVYVPLGVYLFGMLLAGPYDGDYGFFGMTGRIYMDLLKLELTAWFLMLSPALVYLIWRLVAWLPAYLSADKKTN